MCLGTMERVLKAGKRPFGGTSKGLAGFGPAAQLVEMGAGQRVVVSCEQMAALEYVYHTSPSIQAARSILLAQLMSSGLTVRRGGTDVKLTPEFAAHLDAVWAPFAVNVFDAFMTHGFAAVSLEEADPEPSAHLQRTARPKAREEPDDGGAGAGAGAGAGTGTGTGASKPPEAAAERQKQQGDRRSSFAPVVCETGSFQLNYRMGGRRSYKRHYFVTPMHSSSPDSVDEEVAVFFRVHPDGYGNVNSPCSVAYSDASFVLRLQEFALQAEQVRTRQNIVTQSAPSHKNDANQPLDASSLFFDSESRAIASADEQEGSMNQASTLALMAKVSAWMNRQSGGEQQPGGGSAAPASHVPPDLPPRLFALPEKQCIAPVNMPEARTALENLIRVANDRICAALGVPASIIFEGKFSSNSMSQLQLLNSTISSIALSMNTCLTQTYRAVYGGATDDLVLVTSPLASVAEVVALFQAGVVDLELAMPVALHSLGVCSKEIREAVERNLSKRVDGKTPDEQRTELELKAAERAIQQQDVSIAVSKVELRERKEGGGKEGGGKEGGPKRG